MGIVDVLFVSAECECCSSLFSRSDKGKGKAEAGAISEVLFVHDTTLEGFICMNQMCSLMDLRTMVAKSIFLQNVGVGSADEHRT